MANEQQRRLMQEAIDDALQPQALNDLHQRLSSDPDTADDFERLRRVDAAFKGAPFERAPEGLAIKIMARLAGMVDSEGWLRTSGLALAVALTLLAFLLTPLLAVISWLTISALTNPPALVALRDTLIARFGELALAVSQLATEATTFLSANPALTAGVAVGTPLMAIVMVYLVWRRHSDSP